MNLRKILFIALGLFSLALGWIGVILPVLPTTPFLLVSAWAFAKSSKKAEDWFKTTWLYRQYLQDYLKGDGMTWKQKRHIMCTASTFMFIGFVCMYRVPIAQMILFAVWVFHLIYFIKLVKTKETASAPAEAE